MQPAVFIDRDNTLIANDGDLGDPKLVKLITGVGVGLNALHEAGYRIVVVTNQGGVARGQFSEKDVDAVHQRIVGLVTEQVKREGVIDRFYYCPYHPEATVERYKGDHPWRKPHPGMLIQAARDLKLDLARSWMIGDQERDVSAGRSAGCRTVLLSQSKEQVKQIKPTAAASSFSDAVRTILKSSKLEVHPLPNGSTASGRTIEIGGSGVREKPASTRPQPKPRLPGVDFVEPSAKRQPLVRTCVQSGAVMKPNAETRVSVDPARDSVESLRRAVLDLSDEIRSDRMRRSEYTMLKWAGLICQLLALICGLFGLLHLGDGDSFTRWMICAGLMQLLTMTILILDSKG